jgi:hypothetical protein
VGHAHPAWLSLHGTKRRAQGTQVICQQVTAAFQQGERTAGDIGADVVGDTGEFATSTAVSEGGLRLSPNPPLPRYVLSALLFYQNIKCA